MIASIPSLFETKELAEHRFHHIHARKLFCLAYQEWLLIHPRFRIHLHMGLTSREIYLKPQLYPW